MVLGDLSRKGSVFRPATIVFIIDNELPIIPLAVPHEIIVE